MAGKRDLDQQEQFIVHTETMTGADSEAEMPQRQAESEDTPERGLTSNRAVQAAKHELAKLPLAIIRPTNSLSYKDSLAKLGEITRQHVRKPALPALSRLPNIVKQHEKNDCQLVARLPFTQQHPTAETSTPPLSKLPPKPLPSRESGTPFPRVRLRLLPPVSVEPTEHPEMALISFQNETEQRTKETAPTQREPERGEGGASAGSAIGLLEMLFHFQNSSVGSIGSLIGSRPNIILAEKDPNGEKYEQSLLHSVAEMLRCAGGAPIVRIPGRLAPEEWLEPANGRLTFMEVDDKYPDGQRLLELLQGLIASHLSCVVLSDFRGGIDKLANQISNEAQPGVSLTRLQFRNPGWDMIVQILRRAFAYVPPQLWLRLEKA